MRRGVLLYLGVTLAAAAAYLGWVLAGRYGAGPGLRHGRPQPSAQQAAEFERTYGGSGVRILQFYAPAAAITEGDAVTLCYGVVNARSVRIDPPVDNVGVSLNRCVQHVPERDTRYTLTAEGHDGRTVSESFVLQVKPDPAALPKIHSFRVADHRIDRGRHVFLLTFSAANADEIRIEPPVLPPLRGAPNGRFYVAPESTTTYTLTAVGKKGRRDSKQLTVEVPVP